MRNGCQLRFLRTPHLQRHNRFAERARQPCQFLKRRDVTKAFDIKPKRRHAVVADDSLGDTGKPLLGLIARSDGIGNRQSALLHSEINRDIGRLRKDRHAAFNGHQPMLIRPKRHPIHGIQNPVAIRPQNGHSPCCGQQLVVQIRTVGCFFEPAGKTHRASCTHLVQFADQTDGCVTVHSDKCRIRCLR